MATRIKPTPKELYEEDFYVWSQRQAELLRARRYDELDLEHLIEEVEDLGDTKPCGPEHALVDDGAPAQAPALASGRSAPGLARYGAGSATICWIDLTLDLRRIMEEELEEYTPGTPAGRGSLRDHGEHAAADALPQTCPYTADQITGDWLP